MPSQPMRTQQPELLTCKELAAALRRNVSFVWAMRRQGFIMPGGTATLEEARVWLLAHPQPRRNAANGSARQRVEA